MKKLLNSSKWWNSPPALVLSVIAAAALLFFSGKAALRAFADGNDTITISFSVNGGTGSAPANIYVKPGEKVILPLQPDGMTKEGFRFVAWDTAPDGSGTTYYPGETYYHFSDDILLYAVWQEVITVSFDANGGTGSVPEPSADVYSVLVDSIPEKPDDLVRPGYAFWYWCTAPNGNGETYVPGNSHRFYESTVLYAIWNKDITVSYDANGGTGTVPDPVSGQPYLHVTFPEPDHLSKEGAQFMWWNTKPDDSGTYYRSGWSESFSEDTVLYAIWRDTVTVSYDLNGGTGTTPSSETGVPNLYISTPPEPDEREGYRFMNWNTSPDGTGDAYEAGRYYSFNQSVLLYAYWYKRPVVTLSYDSNGGTGPAPHSDSGYETLTATVAAPPENMVRDGYEFLCWNTDPSYNGRNYDPGDELYTYESMVLYARWDKVDIVTVTFDANGATGSVPQSITGRAPLEITIPQKPDDLEKPGYEFIMWNSRSDGEGLNYSPGEKRTVRESFTIYAKWRSVNRITYHANGGTGSVPEPYDVPDWTDITIAEPPADLKKEGCEFGYWNTQPDGSGKSYYPGETESVIWDIDLYAIWREYITVSYDANGGEGSLPEPHVGLPRLDITIRSKPDNLRKKGCYFYSWNSQQSGQGVDYQAGDENNYFTDSIIYAKWKYVSYNVTYDPNISSIRGESVSPRNEPLKTSYDYSCPEVDPETGIFTIPDIIGLTTAGYEMQGWSTDPHAAEPMTQMEFDPFPGEEEISFTLYAVWKEKQYTLSYSPGEDHENVEVPAPVTYSYSDIQAGNASVSTVLPTDEGYSFAGWRLDRWTYFPVENIEAGTDLHIRVSDFDSSRNALLTAEWNRIYHTVTYKPGQGSGTEKSDDYEYGSPAAVKEGNIFMEPFGYEFAGWECDTEGYSTTPGHEITVKDDVTYTASWRQICYTLQYDKGIVPAIKGSLPTARSDIALADLRTGGIYISEEKPQAEGYTFTGWKITNSDDSTISKEYDASKFGSLSSTEKLVDEALFDSSRSATAVAQWITHYTVTYNVSGIPSGFHYPSTQTESYAEGTEVQIKDKPTGFDENTYEFIGWSSNDIDTEQSSFTVNGNIVITGEFRAKAVPPQPDTYTVTYLSGDDAPEEYTDADIAGDYTLLGISDVGFTIPDGMNFDGWVLVSPDNKDYPENANAGVSINVISDVTYNAVWSSASPVFPTAIITYTSGLTEDYPGYNASCSQAFVINEVPTSAEYPVLGNDPFNENNPSFAPDGYEFAGWKLVSGTSGSSSPRPTAASGEASADGLYHEGDTVATPDLISGSVTLKAMWKINLKYDSNGGTGRLPENGEAINRYIDDTVTAANGGNLTRNGARFDHWNTKPNDNETKVQPGQNIVMKDNTVLYAIYTDSPGDDTGFEDPDGTTFTVTYKANGGTGNVPKDEHKYSAGDTVPVASKGDLVRTGCTFKEWNTRPDGSGTGYKGNGSDSFVINADTTLYAIWLDSNGKIIHSPGTGESSIPMIIAFNTTLLSLAALAFIVARERGKTAKSR